MAELCLEPQSNIFISKSVGTQAEAHCLGAGVPVGYCGGCVSLPYQLRSLGDEGRGRCEVETAVTVVKRESLRVCVVV